MAQLRQGLKTERCNTKDTAVSSSKGVIFRSEKGEEKGGKRERRGKGGEVGWSGVGNLILFPLSPLFLSMVFSIPCSSFCLFLFLCEGGILGWGFVVVVGGRERSKAELKILEFYSSFQLVASLCQLN